MPGIINAEMQGADPAAGEGAAPVASAGANPAEKAAPGGKFKSKVIEAIPENMRNAFERIVVAGMKVLYSKEMQPDIQQQLAKNEPVWKKLAEGIANLMTILDRQSGKGLPQDVIIPAAIELVHEYADFLNQQGKMPVSDDDLQQATVYVAIAVAKVYGAKDEDIQAMFQQQGGQQNPDAGQEVPGEAAADPGEQQEPPEAP